MNRWQRLVYEFHKATGGTVGDTITIRDRELRAKLIMEEAVETVAALGYHVTADIFSVDGWSRNDAEGDIGSFAKQFGQPDLEEFVDGMCDLIYVVAGSAVAAGVDLEDHFDEVHRANMTKLDGPKRADGKQLKPEGWQKPDHQSLFDKADRVAEELRQREEALLRHNLEIEVWLDDERKAKPGWH